MVLSVYLSRSLHVIHEDIKMVVPVSDWTQNFLFTLYFIHLTEVQMYLTMKDVSATILVSHSPIYSFTFGTVVEITKN